MKISQLGEFGLIDRIRKKNINRTGSSGAVIGIGDDCAVVKCKRGRNLLFTTDTLIENVHFSKKHFSNFDIGYKSIAINLSDIAAMGGVPLYALITAGFPASTEVRVADEILRGIKKLTREFGVEIIGGDTVKSPTALIISVALIGRTISGTGIKRSGAKPGDVIFTTGPFGDSAVGFRLLQRGITGHKGLKQKHLRPYPKIKDGVFIAKSGFANSMIDSSDGFDKSIRLICEESGVGCEIRFDKIPVSSEFKSVSSSLKLPTSDLILFGGEEFELIFTVPFKKKSYFAGNFYEVGRITRGKDIVYVDKKGKRMNFGNGGYDHFKK